MKGIGELAQWNIHPIHKVHRNTINVPQGQPAVLGSVNGTFCSLDTLTGLKIEHPKHDCDPLKSRQKERMWGGDSGHLTRKNAPAVTKKKALAWIYKEDEKGRASKIS